MLSSAKKAEREQGIATLVSSLKSRHDDQPTLMQEDVAVMISGLLDETVPSPWETLHGGLSAASALMNSGCSFSLLPLFGDIADRALPT